MINSRSLVCLAVLSVMGCVADEDLDEVTNVPTRCSMCDTNGLAPDAVRAALLELSPPAMEPRGLRVAGKMARLCAAVPAAGKCNLAGNWLAWAEEPVPIAVREIRFALLTYMVKSGAPKGVEVHVPSRFFYMPGGFGLAPGILDAPWDSHAQAIVTAAMAALGDANMNGVELCLKTVATANCPLTYRFHEIAMIGNWFEGRGEFAVGGWETERPDDSKRVCPGYGTGCTTYRASAPYHAGRCTYVGPADQRHPIGCSVSPGAPVYGDAVQVFTLDDPKVPGAIVFGPPRL